MLISPNKLRMETSHPMLMATGAPFLLGLSYVASLYVRSRQILLLPHHFLLLRLPPSFIPSGFNCLFLLSLFCSFSGMEVHQRPRPWRHHQEEVCLRCLYDSGRHHVILTPYIPDNFKVSPVFVHFFGSPSLLDTFSLQEIIGGLSYPCPCPCFYSCSCWVFLLPRPPPPRAPARPPTTSPAHHGSLPGAHCHAGGRGCLLLLLLSLLIPLLNSPETINWTSNEIKKYWAFWQLM